MGQAPSPLSTAYRGKYDAPVLIATFNCNSIRSRLQTVLSWMAKHQPDVLALQETKCPDDRFPADPFVQAGYRIVFRGQKSYNGVAMAGQVCFEEVSFGLGDDDGASQVRLAHVRVGDLHVVNTYVPQGQELDSPMFQFKLAWLGRLKAYFQRRFDPSRDLVAWVGDLNIAPRPIDVYDSKSIWPHVCHCQECTDALDDVMSWGLVDVVRKHMPGEGVFTFWDYRFPSMRSNKGWRLDHILVTAPLADRSREVFIDLEPRRGPKPSDHTFVAARFDG